MDSTIDSISFTSDGKLFCNICKANIPGNSSTKSQKQHLKSITHKKASKNGERTISNAKIADDREEEFECMLCSLLEDEDYVHPMDPQSNFFTVHTNGDYEGHVCMAPPFVESPHRTNQAFITLQCGIVQYPVHNFEAVLDKYCVECNSSFRLPNIDIELISQQVKSFGAARKMLQEAHENRSTYWAAFIADDKIKNPKWWPKSDPVPGYTQVIVGSGPTDIGIHIDVYGPTKIPVDTYFTMAAGEKMVMMLPPTTNLEPFEPYLDWNLKTSDAKSRQSKFPQHPPIDLLQKIKDAGGYYFRIKPLKNDRRGQITLFVPKGWYHWLLGMSEWAVIFGSSAF